MDRFKFRCWNKEQQILHYGAEHAYDDMRGDPIIYACCFGDLLDNDNYIVEQCTGLKDKNGNLIYEGDIVSNGCSEGVVKYGEFNCHCCDGVYGWYFDGGDIRDVKFYGIVGNIHEQKGNK